ncbi:cold shock domain-containing protein [Patescibacteria group bacterium]|nr:cold shock domain-containing protein [Patescibacteria group bacterium]MBU1721392.1 cold shock domain-containing protein [Patescibacteria group bacterium]MBU1901832.1 cold shock domain-containing protein [Patescibacteria group bacterium]
MQQGTIKRLTDRGFGFIAVDGQDTDIFFHAKELVDIEFNDLREGDALVFDVVETDKGMNAVNVRRAE